MVREPELHGWLAADEFAQDEEQLLLVHSSVHTEVRLFLGRLLGSIPDPIAQGPRPVLPGFYILKLPASRIDPRLFDGGTVPPAMTLIRPRGTQGQARLSGGLPLRSGSGRRTYLRHGAPDVLLPVGRGGARDVEAELDGAASVIRATGLPLPLVDLVTEPGDHEFVADGVALRFRLVDGSGLLAAPQSAGLGWDVHSGAAGWELTNRTQTAPGVCGAVAPPPDVSTRRTIKTEGCRTIYLFGENPGEIQEFAVPASAPHADVFSLNGPPFIHVALQFAPKWLVRNWAAPEEKPKVWAKPVTFSGALPGPRFKPTAVQIDRWRTELKRLAAASADSAWQRLTLRAWWS
jgi:hypothetical protein